jgi:apolipoprotein N-acyltransferase
MTYYFAPKARRWSMSRFYMFYVWFIILFGIVTLSWVGTEDGPGAILDILAFMSAAVMGAYCILLLFVNNRLLPRKLRPGLISNIALGIGVLLYLGGTLWSWLVMGALP